MVYFTHDQVVKTLKFLYPQVKHGYDYRCVMPVADTPKFIPLGDASIEAWTADNIPEPSIDYLKQVWVEEYGPLAEYVPPSQTGATAVSSGNIPKSIL